MTSCSAGPLWERACSGRRSDDSGGSVTMMSTDTPSSRASSLPQGIMVGPGSAQLKPDRRMVRRFFHAAQFVVHTGGLHPRQQAVGGEDQVDAQAALGFVFEATAAVVEPAEGVGHV